MSKVNITLPAYYYDDSFCDDTLFAAQLTGVDLVQIAALKTKVAELSSLVTDFQELVVRFTGHADFIKSVEGEGTAERFLDESESDLPLKFHAEPISDELFHAVRARGVNLHVRKDGFYVKGFEKHSNTAMETDLVYFDKLPV